MSAISNASTPPETKNTTQTSRLPVAVASPEPVLNGRPVGSWARSERW